MSELWQQNESGHESRRESGWKAARFEQKSERQIASGNTARVGKTVKDPCACWEISSGNRGFALARGPKDPEQGLNPETKIEAWTALRSGMRCEAKRWWRKILSGGGKTKERTTITKPFGDKTKMKMTTLQKTDLARRPKNRAGDRCWVVNAGLLRRQEQRSGEWVQATGTKSTNRNWRCLRAAEINARTKTSGLATTVARGK
jgi:hypothetical protein